MDLRVTQQTIIQNAISATRNLGSQIVALQTQVATGKRLTQVSDDPAAAMAVLANDAHIAQFDTNLDNISHTTATLDMSVSTLLQVSNIFSSARSVALEAGNSTNDAAAMEALAREVDGMIDQLFGLANGKSGDHYLYGGTASTTQPFVVTQSDAQGRPLAIHYQGDDGVSNTLVERRQIVPVQYPGTQVFGTRERKPTTFTGSTGAVPGVGTDTLTGTAILEIKHTTTTFAPGSGVLAGTGSTVGDTILGPAGRHRLHITDTSGTGAAGTVTLDGGATYAFTSADTNLKVVSPTGDVAFLNMSAISPSFDGDIDITSNGTISIDGGQTTTALDFTNAQIARDAASGRVSFVDTSNVARTGKEIVTYPGTYDAFQSLITLRDELRNKFGRPAADHLQAISNHINELDHVRDNVLNTVGSQSASLQNLEALDSHLQDMQLAAEKASSDLNGVDMSEVVVKLQSYSQMLELSLATFARIMNVSLLDFLR